MSWMQPGQNYTPPPQWSNPAALPQQGVAQPLPAQRMTAPPLSMPGGIPGAGFAYPGVATQPYMAQQAAQPVDESGITPVVSQPLVNGATGFFQQAAGRTESVMYVTLPVDPFQGGAHRLLASTILDGSRATKGLLDQMAAYGIDVMALPMKDRIVISASGPPDQEERMMDLVFRLLSQPQVEQETFDKYIQDLRDSIQEAQKIPAVRLADQLDKAVYGKNHPYGMSGPEILNQVETTTLPQVMALHQQLMARPEQFNVMVVSPNPVGQQQRSVNGSIQTHGLFAQPNVAPLQPASIPVQPLRGEQGPVLLADETLERAQVTMTWPAPVLGDPDYLTHGMLIRYLNGRYGFFDALRTKRDLVYGVRPSETEHQNVGTFGVRAEVNYDKVGETVSAMNDVVNQVMGQPISDKQLEMLKREYLLSLRDAAQSSIGVSAVNVGRVIKGMPKIHPSELEVRIKAITPQDIQRVAQRFMHPAMGYRVTGIAAPSAVLQTLQGQPEATTAATPAQPPAFQA